MAGEQTPYLDTLKDCTAYQVIQASSGLQKKKGRSIKQKQPDAELSQDELAEELDEFISYLTQEAYEALPESLKSNSTQLDESQVEKLQLASIPVPPAFAESLVTYSLVESEGDAEDAFQSIMKAFTEELSSLVTEAREASLPPKHGWKSTRCENCEICHRDVPLTYHHLIPRSTHDKVLRRKWHPPEMLNVVAWLCRPCHTAVHRSAPNEDLARYYYSVELLMERESIQRWAQYASRQRWGGACS
ncbi:SubName: Full=Uncharacterized protein {ECO:0000313/EMBL:CCA74432.1} [Serendipita indica DSM 11827]|nr:SubName: Full=Uncharacterized protein {ECO:0000313/EMBL:CCA74432.1} [Serendipita indica DSM 11827]